jgi:probable HAF family extracellular repeat protein
MNLKIYRIIFITRKETVMAKFFASFMSFIMTLWLFSVLAVSPVQAEIFKLTATPTNNVNTGFTLLFDDKDSDGLFSLDELIPGSFSGAYLGGDTRKFTAIYEVPMQSEISRLTDGDAWGYWSFIIPSINYRNTFSTDQWTYAIEPFKAQHYEFQDLGTLGGNSSDARCINNQNQIVGQAQTSNGQWRAFLKNPGEPLQNLGILPGYDSYNQFAAYGINDSGVIVGNYNWASGSWNFGSWIKYPDKPMEMLPIGALSGVCGINNAGQIAGTGGSWPCGWYPFLINPGEPVQFLGGLVPRGMCGTGNINDKGQIVGGGSLKTCGDNSIYHAYLWQNGVMEDLGTLPGGSYSEARSINNNGQIAGYANGSGFTGYHAFLKNPDQPMEDLGTLGGDTYVATGKGINLQGRIVGQSQTASGAWHAFIWVPGEGMQDLNNLTVNLPDGITLYAAYAINDNGWIVGVTSGTYQHAFVLVPVLENKPPTAEAGPDQIISQAGATVNLNGSGSSDPDGDTLTYAWSFVSRPNGSATTLSDPAAVNPSFTVDREGNYVLQLVVTDSHGTASAPDTVTISTSNTKPVAAVTADPQAVIQVGTTVQLDGSTSYDLEDGTNLTYQWDLIHPDGSAALLSDPNSKTPTFVVDVHGDYYANLIVRDSWGAASNTAQVKISFDNLAPVADAGMAQSTHVGDTVTLDGSGSRDPNNDVFTYQWSLTTMPAGSSATLSGAMTVSPSFTPDLPGTYAAQLVVTDDSGLASDASTVQVLVVTLATWATEKIQTELQPTIAALPADKFVNPNLQKTMMNKTNAVIAAIQAGNIQDARDKLQNDLLKKVDGCATSGAPDKNDWIKDPVSQKGVYQQILAVIQELGG